MGDSFERFAQMLSNATKSLYRLKSRYMSNYGLSSTHTVCLRKLYESRDGLTKSEISDTCGIDKAQTTRIMGELIAKNYVEDDSSKKTYNRKFFLTEAGRKMTEEINQTVEGVVEYVNLDIPREEIEQFYTVFEAINKRLKDSEEFFKKGN
ncbi:MAG: hypothetical protein IKB02_03820 [Clostridia bacterium]|nr:hypothetical protein [Clostridia bacterium]